jgi:hypothetical protein
VPAGGYYPPFRASAVGQVNSGITTFDNSENSAISVDSEFSGQSTIISTLDDEVNVLSFNYFAESGWARIALSATVGCEQHYTGVPSLNAVLKTKEGGFFWAETGDRRQGM